MHMLLLNSGSPVENWHSILRKGLINYSGTELQLNGTACGNGIYLSPDASIPASYTESRYSPRFLVKVGFIIIVITSIIISKTAYIARCVA